MAIQNNLNMMASNSVLTPNTSSPTVTYCEIYIINLEVETAEQYKFKLKGKEYKYVFHNKTYRYLDCSSIFLLSQQANYSKCYIA
jgi:hypothetical protein